MAISVQTNHKKFFKSVAKQSFSKISWVGIERKVLYLEDILTRTDTNPQNGFAILRICIMLLALLGGVFLLLQVLMTNLK
ncbi:MAG: hypothetical protein ACK59W_17590, partial [Pseudanabaena sp.]